MASHKQTLSIKVWDLSFLSEPFTKECTSLCEITGESANTLHLLYCGLTNCSTYSATHVSKEFLLLNATSAPS